MSCRVSKNLAANLRRRECATFGPKRLSLLAGGGDRGRIAAILAATDVGKVAGAVASDAVGCWNREVVGCVHGFE